MDAALRTGLWRHLTERRFDRPVHIASFEELEQRMMRPTFADHRIDDTQLAAVRAALQPHLRRDGARFMRPMHVRPLQRAA